MLSARSWRITRDAAWKPSFLICSSGCTCHPNHAKHICYVVSAMTLKRWSTAYPNHRGDVASVKDVVGPKGSVSIVSSIDESSDIASHSLAESLRVHPNGLGVEDKIISIEDTPDHDGLCLRQVRPRCNDLHSQWSSPP